jgi:hypothetical protein
MDIILSSGRFTKGEVRRLNYCRLYLKAVTISDLTTIHGNKLDLIILHGGFFLVSSSTRMPFVLQDRPSQLEWKLWERANGLWSNPHGELFIPLGQWLIGVHHMQQDHFAYATVTRMWIRQHDMYVVCHRVRDDYYEESDIRASVLNILPVASPVRVLHLRVQKISTLVIRGLVYSIVG